jgi:predicted DNA-binding transcriptional regulator AlpA
MTRTIPPDIDISGCSLVMQMLLVETYGPRLNVEQLAKVLGLSKGAIYNQISANMFPIETYIDGGKRWADYRDVAAHLDRCREFARSVEPRRNAMPLTDARLRSRAQ